MKREGENADPIHRPHNTSSAPVRPCSQSRLCDDDLSFVIHAVKRSICFSAPSTSPSGSCFCILEALCVAFGATHYCKWLQTVSPISLSTSLHLRPGMSKQSPQLPIRIGVRIDGGLPPWYLACLTSHSSICLALFLLSSSGFVGLY